MLMKEDAKRKNMQNINLASRFIPAREAFPSISWFKLSNCHILLFTIMFIGTAPKVKKILRGLTPIDVIFIHIHLLCVKKKNIYYLL